MYLHLIDDARAMAHFVRRIRLHFPGSHQFLVFNSTGTFSHIPPGNDISAFLPTDHNCKELARTLDQYKGVFVHNLCYDKSRIVINAATEVVFLWGIWGFDYYNTYPRLFWKLFLPYTRLVNILLGKMQLTYLYLRSLTNPITNTVGIKTRQQVCQQAADRINFTFNTLPHHSEVFQVVQMPATHRFHLAYYSVDAITKGLDRAYHDLGTNILIGNSSSSSSNHTDIFFKLRKQVEQQNVVVVLGYGSQRYRRFINFLGRLLFKQRYQPINQTLPLDVYNRKLLECNVMLMNHRRAQALGNIIFGVWAGHKIYLREENPAYPWLMEMGISVFSIQSHWPENGFTPLSMEDRIKNRQIIEQYYDENQVVEDLRSMLTKV